MLVDGLIALITASTAVPGPAYQNSLPRDYKLPATVIHQSSGLRETDLSGPIGVREADVQFDCYGHNPAESNAGGLAVKALLEPFLGTLPDGTKVLFVRTDMDMDFPYKPSGDAKGLLDRWLLKLHFVITAP